MTTATSSDYFRRTKKPVHPKKVPTREVLHGLKSVGIDILDKCHLHEAIHSIIERDRSVMDDIINAARTCGWKEKALWRYYVSNLYSYMLDKNMQSRHREMMERIPIVAPIITSADHAGNQYYRASVIIDSIVEALPDGDQHDLNELFKAATLYEELVASASRKSDGYYSRWKFDIDRTNIGHVLEIADVVDEAEKMKPSLMELRIIDGTRIKAIVENGSVPLSAGAL